MHTHNNLIGETLPWDTMFTLFLFRPTGDDRGLGNATVNCHSFPTLRLFRSSMRSCLLEKDAMTSSEWNCWSGVCSILQYAGVPT